MPNWEDFIDNIKDSAGTLAKDQLKGLINDAKSDSNAFIKQQGQSMEMYLNQLAAGDITKDQFKGYITDLQDLTNLEKLKMIVDAKARAQKLVDGITDLIINGLLSLI